MNKLFSLNIFKKSFFIIFAAALVVSGFFIFGNVAQAATTDVQVSNGSDDCWRAKGEVDTFNLEAEMIVGSHDAPPFFHGVGMRFLNITIPPNSVITDAYFSVRAKDTRENDTVNTKISGEYVVNPITFSTLEDFDVRERTSHVIDWNAIEHFVAGNWYNSPNIKDIIQEIIDRAGWASGNAIVIFWDNFDRGSTYGALISRNLNSYEENPTYVAKLHIEYTPVINVPGDYLTIQEAIDAANPGDTINVAVGTYVERLNITQDRLTIAGENQSSVIMDVTSLTVGYGSPLSAVHITGNNVTFKNFTFSGSSGNSTLKRAIKVDADGVTLENIEIGNMGKTGVDIINSNNTTIKNINVHNGGNAGFFIKNVNGLHVENISTYGNAWGGMSLASDCNYSPCVVDNVEFFGTNTFVDSLYFEAENGGTLPTFGYSISNAVILLPTDFVYVLSGSPIDYPQLYFFKNVSDAYTMAVTNGHPHVADGTKYIRKIDTNDYYVSEGMAIQKAVNAANSGDTINVAAGTYTENVNVNKSLTLQGVSSAAVTVSAAINTVDVFTVTASNVNISGFTVTGANGSGGPNYAGIRLINDVMNCDIHDNILTGNQYGILLIATENTTTPGNNTFTSNTASGNSVSGIEMQHSYGNTFTNNITNSNIGSSNTGYGFKLDSARHNTFTGNTANLNKKGFYLTKGDGVGSNDNTFTNNTANLNTRYGFAHNGLSSGTILTGNTFDSNVISGVRLEDTVTNLNMQNNNITNNPKGIDIATVATDVTTWTVSHNNISGNTTYGVSNAGTGVLNAVNNWWGAASGPYNATNNPIGTGDAVSDKVAFSPWYANAEKTSWGGIMTPSGENKVLSLPTPIDILTTNLEVKIPIGTDVTGPTDGWDGTINAPTVKDVPDVTPSVAGHSTVIDTIIEVGFPGAKLTFNKAVRLLFPGKAGKRVGYVRTDGSFQEITTPCDNDAQTAADTQLIGDIEDCKIDVVPDLVVWTKHFTQFITYNIYLNSPGSGSSFPPPAPSPLGDTNGDNKVDKYDFSLMMANWGKIGSNNCDLNNDSKVDKYDFALLMLNWSM